MNNPTMEILTEGQLYKGFEHCSRLSQILRRSGVADRSAWHLGGLRSLRVAWRCFRPLNNPKTEKLVPVWTFAGQT